MSVSSVDHPCVFYFFLSSGNVTQSVAVANLVFTTRAHHTSLTSRSAGPGNAIAAASSIIDAREQILV